MFKSKLHSAAGRRRRRHPSENRRGSVLLVMLGLLLILMLIGMTIFTFSTQENSSAEYFANSAKNYDLVIDSDALFDWALEQLIIGPNDSNTQSALWPGVHSLVPRSLGLFSANAQGVPIPSDRHPFDGVGFNVATGAGGQPLVDTNYDGDPATNDNPEYLAINYSYAARAQAGGLGAGYAFFNRIQLLTNLPAIDAGYTYPDINNVFLAHVGTIPPPAAAPDNIVIIPSFHRPQYLRDNGGTSIANWAINESLTNTDTRTKVLCPHPAHYNSDGTTYRYIRPDLFPAGITVGTRTILPFRFQTDANGNTIFDEQGVWSGTANIANFDYPVDNDGDGRPDSVWVDLGFPPVLLPDGRTFVPLFAFMVLDADGLANVNLHSNIAGIQSLAHPFVGTADPFGGSNPSISRSNQGLSPSEVNLWWPLSADPEDVNFLNPPVANGTPTNALQQYRVRFVPVLDNTTPGYSGTGYQMTRAEMANLDLFALLHGRAKYDVTGSGPENGVINDLSVGRFGDRSALLAGATSGALPSYPRPGVIGVDDDNDAQAGVNDYPYEPMMVGMPSQPTYGMPLLPYGFPLDFLGNGQAYQTVNYGGGNIRAARLIADPSNALSNVRYRVYSGYNTGSQYQTVAAPLTGQLVLNPKVNANTDEADEQTSMRQYTPRFGAAPIDLQPFNQNDQTYGPDEMAGLHLSQGDYTSTLTSSRLRQVAPFNFETNLQAAAIRKRFTTDSWDRREHGFAFCNYPLATPRGNWEFNADIDGDATATSGYEFPPLVFAPVGAFNPATPFANLNAAEPIRDVVRTIIGCELGSELGNFTLANSPTPMVHNQQLRLNINKLCTTQFPNQPVGTANVPGFRQLTPHPEILTSTVIPGSFGSATPVPTTYTPSTFTANPEYQEYWARIDRQKMARDIYVLLYLFGGGRDNIDYATTSNQSVAGVRAVYTDAQLAEMAQFAVNVVDSLDRDNVITRFEYDRNLADGWNLDDNPYTTTASDGETGSAVGAGDRGDVWGVESQGLTISEVLAIRQDQILSNHAATPYQDHQGLGRCFLFAELRNASPYPVSIAQGAWRLRVVRPAGGTNRSVVFMRNSLNPANPGMIPADGNYTIGTWGRDDDVAETFVNSSTGNPQPFGSDFRVDYDGDGTFNLVAPAALEVTPPGANQYTPPLTNLDLVDDRDWNANYFQLIDHGAAPATTPPGGSINLPTNTNVTLNPGERGGLYKRGATAENVHFILERRVHPTRTAPLWTSTQELADNPWVEVDRFQIFNAAGTLHQTKRFNLQVGDNSTTIQALLLTLISDERSNILDRTFAPNNTASVRSNSLGLQANSIENSANPVIWQQQLDRDFASVMELLSVPLYGPDTLTARVSFQNRVGIEGLDAIGAPEARLAQAKFLRPSAPVPANNNRWYRILELLEVPSRANRQVEYALNARLKRVPAKVNLNGLRHPEVLFALLDDPFVFDLALQDTFETGRRWWDELLKARDGIDPATNMTLPGSPAARPFRDFSFAAGQPASGIPAPGPQGVPALQRTLARQLMFDSSDLNNNMGPDPGEGPLVNAQPFNPPTTAPRQLLEARTTNDLNNTQNYVDPHARHRLLAKVANNSTNRSNVFMVWVTVGFFDTDVPNPATPNIVRIGAEMPDQARRRGFFMIDRSVLEDAYDPATNTFDFRTFIQYRKTIQ